MDTPEDEIVMEANCGMGSEVEYYFAKGMFMNVSSICELCETKHECNTTQGWYKHDKKAVLKESVYVTEPEGLDFTTFCDAKGKPWVNPDTQQPGVVLMIDESAAMPWVQTTVVTFEDLVEHCNEFGFPLNRLRFNTSFLKVLDALVVAMAEPDREASIPHHKVMALIESKLRQGEVDVADALEITLLEESLLDGVTEMKSAWCTPLLEAMFGRGRIWVEGHQLFLMRPNQRFIEALHHPAVRQVIFFDGTGAVTELEGWLGEHIEVIEERAPAEQAEIRIKQYVGLGRMGFTRQAVQEKQTNILLDQLNVNGVITRDTPVVDIKRTKVGKARKPLTWLSTSRGSNSAAKAKDLVIIGAPGTNLTAALNRYCLLYGVDLELEDTGTFHRRFWTQAASRNEGGGLFIESARESTHRGFRNYYRKLIEAELDQALHRLRGVRRPGEVLNVHWISDFCHPRWEVELVRADEVADLFSPVGLEVGTVQAAIKKLAQTGNPRPTHHQVATELGVRSADVARWIGSDPWLEAEFGWLDRTRRRSPAYTATKTVAEATARREPPREPIPDENLVRMRELLPLGTRVTHTYDRRKEGLVVDYLLERGIPKFVVEWGDASRGSFPKNLLTFSSQLVA
jgi:hypothetical protein